MNIYFSIALGGALGAMARYWLGSSVERFNTGAFPLGTFSVNLVGSFLIGLLFVLFLERLSLAEQLRPLLVIGFLGSMTTFSTFSLDALLLLQQGHYNTALIYIAGSVATCLFAAYIGLLFGRAIF